MEGYLSIKGRFTYSTYWALLDEQQLSYYDHYNVQKRRPEKLKGVIELKGATITKYSSSSIDHGITLQTVLPRSQKWYFDCHETAICGAWFVALHRAANFHFEKLEHVIQPIRFRKVLGFPLQKEMEKVLDSVDELLELSEKNAAQVSHSQIVSMISSVNSTTKKLPPLTRDELNRFYKRACLRNHPDKGGDANRFNDIRVAYNGLIASLESTEEMRKNNFIQYEATVEKLHIGGLAIIVVEDRLRRRIVVDGVRENVIKIHSISAEANGAILPGDVLIGIDRDDCSDWWLSRVRARLDNFRVPLGTTVTLTFERSVVNLDDPAEEMAGVPFSLSLNPPYSPSAMRSRSRSSSPGSSRGSHKQSSSPSRFFSIGSKNRLSSPSNRISRQLYISGMPQDVESPSVHSPNKFEEVDALDSPNKFEEVNALDSPNKSEEHLPTAKDFEEEYPEELEMKVDELQPEILPATEPIKIQASIQRTISSESEMGSLVSMPPPPPLSEDEQSIRTDNSKSGATTLNVEKSEVVLPSPAIVPAISSESSRPLVPIQSSTVNVNMDLPVSSSGSPVKRAIVVSPNNTPLVTTQPRGLPINDDLSLAEPLNSHRPRSLSSERLAILENNSDSASLPTTRRSVTPPLRRVQAESSSPLSRAEQQHSSLPILRPNQFGMLDLPSNRVSMELPPPPPNPVNTEMMEELKQLRAELTTLKEENSALKDEKSEMNMVIDKLNTENIALSEENSLLNDALSKADIDKSEFEEEITSLSSQIYSLQDENGNLTLAIESLQKNNQEYIEEINSLKLSMEPLEKQLLESKQSERALLQSNELMTRQMRALQETVRDQSPLMQRLLTQLCEYESAVESQRAEIEGLRQSLDADIASVSYQTAVQNLASMYTRVEESETQNLRLLRLLSDSQQTQTHLAFANPLCMAPPEMSSVYETREQSAEMLSNKLWQMIQHRRWQATLQTSPQ